MSAWLPIESAPECKVVMTKIDDGRGVRNEQELKRIRRLWFFPDGSMYVYYEPTHWKETEADVMRPGLMAWRMQQPCANCPFNKSGPGLKLRRSLSVVRWKRILGGLQRGEHFTCHKTTDETGDGSNLMCAGAIVWQNKRGVDSQLQRCMERVDWLSGKKTS